MTLSTMTPQLPLYIDSTMRSTFVACPQKFHNEFLLGLRPQGLSIDLHAGGCFSTALETVYKSVWTDRLDLDASLLRAEAAFALAWGDFEIPAHVRTSKTRDRVWEAVESYFAKYPPLTDHVTPYFDSSGKPTYEYSFAIPLDGDDWPTHPSGTPFLYTGRFDMLGTLNGRPVVRDEKTTKNSFSQFWAESWSLRGQFIGYVWACRQCGLDVQSVVVRGIQILKTGINQQECEKTFSEMLQARWLEQLRRDLWRLRRCYDEGYWDYNFAEACTNYGNCVFMDMCQSARPEIYHPNFIRRVWDPLSKGHVKDEQNV